MARGTDRSDAATAGLSPAERDMIGHVRVVVRDVVEPRAAEIDATAEFPSDVYGAFQDMGLIGLLVPEEDGGVGASVLAAALLYVDIAKASATVSCILTNSLEALVPIVLYANPELKDEVLRRVLDDGEIPSFALTEPGAGSDATSISTRAVRHGDHYVINGRKCFITNGSVAALHLLFAVTDPGARKGARLSAFVIDSGTPGFSVGRDEPTMGLRGSPLTELILNDVEVPVARMVGEEGDGVKVAMKMLNEARVGAAAQCVGISLAAVERASEHALQRQAFGTEIANFQSVQLMLADMAIRTEGARQLTLASARAYDEGSADLVRLSAIAKSVASDAAVQNSLDAIQVFGGSGFCVGTGVERLLRDSKAYQIFDGTNQILRLAVAKEMLFPRKRRG
jgi:alkylation response protein AidB-like acyl-CoA dehydrogenase